MSPQPKQNTAAKKDEPKETPRERFVRLAEVRVSRALGDIRQIRQLANKERYEYNDMDVSVILKVLRDEITALDHDLRVGKPVRGVEFHLNADNEE